MKYIMNKMKTSEMRSWIVLSTAMSIMLCIFAPLNIYLTNINEFWFVFWQLVPILLILFLISFFILLTMGLCVGRFKKIYNLFYGVFLGIFLYLYIQGNYLPRDYGILDGASIDWKTYSSYAIASVILGIVCLVFIILLSTRFRQYLYKVGKLLSVFILLIQISTLGVLFIQHFSVVISSQPDKIITKRDMLDFSDDENIIVFILDAFDASYMDEILTGDDAEYNDSILKDFTYYPDTVGAYPSTRASIPFILSGIWNDNSLPYDSYVLEAFRKTKIYDSLRDNNYKVNLYPSTYSYLSKEIDYCSNVEKGKYVVSNYYMLSKNIMELVAYNYMPHQVKKYFYVDSAAFDILKTTNTEYPAFQWDLLDFYDYYKHNGINTACEKKTFKIYHISGTHPEYTFDENLKNDLTKQYTVQDEERGNVELLRQFFTSLKQQGIYDSSTIILMADHGFINGSDDFNSNPLFMIKNKDECHEHVIVSELKMAWDYLDDIFVSLSNGDYVTEDYLSEFDNEARRFLYYSWSATGFSKIYLPTITEYYCKGQAKNIHDYYATGNTYNEKNQVENYEYTLGSMIDYKSNEDDVNRYILHGISGAEEAGSWTYDHFVNLKFKIEEDYFDLKVFLDIGIVYNDFQQIEILANGSTVGSFEISGGENLEVIIPNKCVKNGELLLSISIPNAQKPDNGDERLLGFMLQQLAIENFKENN